MPQTQGTTPHPVTVYRHMTMSLCHPLMWNATLEYTTTHFNVLGQAVTRPRNPPSTFHTHQRTLNFIVFMYDVVMVVLSHKLGRKCIVPNVMNPGHVVCESITLSRCFLYQYLYQRMTKWSACPLSHTIQYNLYYVQISPDREIHEDYIIVLIVCGRLQY